MARSSPSIAKNAIRRSLMAIIDPLPVRAQIDELWTHFGDACAYCGVTIQRSSRTGHLDHLVSAAQGGTNSIFNHALACARCNGDQKRELPWLDFLATTATDPNARAERQDRIMTWLSRDNSNTRSAHDLGKAAPIVADAIAAFEAAVVKMRELRDASGSHAAGPGG